MTDKLNLMQRKKITGKFRCYACGSTVENIGSLEQFLPVCLICVRELGFSRNPDMLKAIYGNSMDDMVVDFWKGDA